MSTPALPTPQRKVVLRLPGGASGDAAHAHSQEVENLFRHAHALGLPLHHEPQIAALLVSLRMSSDVPPLLYAAAAAVLAAVYDASAPKLPMIPGAMPDNGEA